MKKKSLLLGLSLFSAVAIVAGVLASKGFKNNIALDAAEKDYVLTINGDDMTQPVDTKVREYPVTAKTENGNDIIITSSNDLCIYGGASGGWGGFYNGVQADAEFHNTTAITGIKKIEFSIWWNIFKFDGTEENVVNITTAANSAFTTDANTYSFTEKAGLKVNTTESFELNVADAPSYFKFDFGTTSAGKTRHAYCIVRSMRITYSCAAITKDNFNLTAQWWESRPGYVAPGPSGTFDAPTANGDSVTIVCNSWVEYPNSWGCIFTNGQHWDAEFHNSTSLGKILKIEFGMWWDVYNASSNTGEKIVNIFTASDAAFTENVKKTQFKKTAESTTAQTRDSYSLVCDGTASYFKFTFGDSAANAHFSGVTTFKVTFTA